MGQNIFTELKISKTKVLVLASGEGSTFKKTLDYQSPYWALCGLIANKPCGAFEIAQNAGLDAKLCRGTDYDSYQEWDRALTDLASSFKPDLILLAGFLKKIGPQFLEAFQVINTHPSLLPQYGGQGMYGSKIHQAVFANKELFTGVTIHRVDGEYDQGGIINQCKINIGDCKSAEEIEFRVKAREKDFLLQTLDEYCQRQESN